MAPLTAVQSECSDSSTNRSTDKPELPAWVLRLADKAEGLLYGSISVDFVHGKPKMINRVDKEQLS